MARLLVTTPDLPVREIPLAPGCNRLGREGENDFLITHPSISRQHCEVWVMDDCVMVRDLQSRNGTFVEDTPVGEAEVLEGQRLRVGDVELILQDAPVRISVPDLPIPQQPKQQQYMPDGTPCCLHHDGVPAKLQCTKCHKTFCTTCVRELRVAGGVPRRFCTECGGPCERLAPTLKEGRRSGWLGKLVDAFTKPTARR
jgi:hypothetical protein